MPAIKPIKTAKLKQDRMEFTKQWLKEHNIEFSELAPYHLRVTTPSTFIDVWPSTGKWKEQGQEVNKNIDALFALLEKRFKKPTESTFELSRKDSELLNTYVEQIILHWDEDYIIEVEYGNVRIHPISNNIFVVAHFGSYSPNNVYVAELKINHDDELELISTQINLSDHKDQSCSKRLHLNTAGLQLCAIANDVTKLLQSRKQTICNNYNLRRNKDKHQILID